MTNPFSSAFLAQLKEKEKAASVPTPPAETPSPAAESATTEIKEIKDVQGRLSQRIPFKEGKIHGTMEIYNPETQALTHKMPYAEGKLEGLFIAYDETQKPSQEIPYVQGQKKGLACFYRHGSKTSEISYENDKMNGPATFYGPNEMVQARAYYKDNHLEGPFQSFDGKKNIVRDCTYVGGLLTGPCKTFYPSGKVFEEAVYKENKVQGAQTQYLEDGTILRRVTHNDKGQPIKEETFSSKGEKLTEKEISPQPPLAR